MGRGVWQATVHGATKSQTQLRNWAHAAQYYKKPNNQTKKWAADLNRHFSKKDIQMAKRHIKKHSTSLLEKDKSKLQWDNHLTAVRMAIIKKSTNNKYWRGYGENGTLLHNLLPCRLLQSIEQGSPCYTVGTWLCVCVCVCVCVQACVCVYSFPSGSVVKNPPANACQRHGFDSWVRKIPWRRKWLLRHYSCLASPMDREAWRDSWGLIQLDMT